MSPITRRAGGLFDWAEDGPLAHACEVTDADGHIIDCAAWYPDRPQAWWLLTGAGRVLGEHVLGVVNPIHLKSHPQAWLRANHPCGVSILNWRIWPALLFDCRV